MPNNKIKTPTIEKRGGSFKTNTPDGVESAAVLDEIEREFPKVQAGRAWKFDLLNGGKLTKKMYANYSLHQAESVRRSAEKSRAKTKLKKEAVTQLIEIRDVLGEDEVIRILTEEGV